MSIISASKGIAIGRAFIYKENTYEIKEISSFDIDFEKGELFRALELSKQQLNKLYEKTLEKLSEKEADIFKVHKLILEDPQFLKETLSELEKNKTSLYAVNKVLNNFINTFKKMDSEYFRDRVVDFEDVKQRLIMNILGLKENRFIDLTGEFIVVAEELNPSDTAFMNEGKVLGVITGKGGKTSHTAIICKSMGIPYLTGLKDQLGNIKDGDLLIIDAYTGQLIINPSKKILDLYKDKKNSLDSSKAGRIERMLGKEVRSLDKKRINLYGNIRNNREIENILKNEADGVGLYRTEYIYMSRTSLPSELEQFEIYKDAAQKLKGKKLTIRTLDVGGDKDIPYLNLEDEINPFLGCRGIRFSFKRPDIFKTQLRAILRASIYGDIRLIFPMVSTINEVREIKDILEICKAELKKEGFSFNRDIDLGIMVEVPSVAINADLFAKEVDFFSIGSNDLTQYTLALDRGNEAISYLDDKFNLASLRLIYKTIREAHKNGIEVGMCGELASEPSLTKLFLAMGLDEFSVNESSLQEIKSIILDSKVDDADILKILSSDSQEEFLYNLKGIETSWPK